MVWCVGRCVGVVCGVVVVLALVEVVVIMIVVCVVGVCVCVWCVWCVWVARWNKPRVDSERLRVYIQNVSVCAALWLL